YLPAYNKSVLMLTKLEKPPFAREKRFALQNIYLKKKIVETAGLRIKECEPCLLKMLNINGYI
ncbi:MAG: hypothetical protein RRY35_07890, partial [Clostridiales bacterium]